MRLSNHDYNYGSYFITIVTKDRLPSFGKVVEGKMILNPAGEIAFQTWKSIPDHLPHVYLDEFIVMPDHVHGILHLHKDSRIPGQEHLKRVNQFGRQLPQSLAVCVNQYKSTVTRTLRKGGFQEFGWQSRYHDRYIRTAEEAQRIRNYILQNPSKWKQDPLYWYK